MTRGEGAVAGRDHRRHRPRFDHGPVVSASGAGDMVQAASLALHVCQMSGTAEIDACFDMVTWKNAEILALEDYGVAPGCQADLAVFDASSKADVLRIQPGVHPRLQARQAGRRDRAGEPHRDGRGRSTSRSATERGVSEYSGETIMQTYKRAAPRHALRAQ